MIVLRELLQLDNALPSLIVYFRLTQEESLSLLGGYYVQHSYLYRGAYHMLDNSIHEYGGLSSQNSDNRNLNKFDWTERICLS